MKRLNVLFVAVVMFVAAGVVKAQKFAALDYQEILTVMPETKKVSEDLDAFAKGKDSELKKMDEAFKAEVKKYQEGAAKLTEAQRHAKETELQKTQQNLQQFALTAQQDLQKRREVLLKPVIDKLNSAIEKAAKANGWDYVVDASAFLYKSGPDASAAVKKELGIK